MPTQPSADSTDAVGAVETEVALLIRRAEAFRRATSDGTLQVLDRAGYVILRRLDDTGPQNVSSLADALGLDGSTVTRQVAALERDGLVSRRPDPRDRRGAVIEATPSGVERMTRVRRARCDLYAQVLRDWPDDDRASLAGLLHRLNHDLDRYSREH